MAPNVTQDHMVQRDLHYGRCLYSVHIGALNLNALNNKKAEKTYKKGVAHIINHNILPITKITSTLQENKNNIEIIKGTNDFIVKTRMLCVLSSLKSKY